MSFAADNRRKLCQVGETIMCAAEGFSPFCAVKIPAMTFCSVCLDPVVEGKDRSIARLTCGHSFHLDCIGSAFNAKGRMQCPTCRGVEQGRWLYANACYLNEDSVEDSLLQQETDVYRTAGVSQLNHSPWCPHQGFYEHISLTFEQLMNLGHGYADSDSLWSVLHRQRICPYLVGVHNIPVHSTRTENSMSLGLNNMDGSSSHNVPRGARHVRQARLALSSHSGSWVPYGGAFRSSNQNGPNFHPYHSHQMLGFLSDSPQSTYARFGEGTNARGQQSGQHMHNQGDQMIGRHSHPHTANLVWNAQANNRRARHSEAIRTTRQVHSYYVQRPQVTEPTMNGYPPWLGPSTSHRPSMAPFVDGTHWAAGGPRVAYGLPAYWWAWAPFETSHRNMATNPVGRAQRTLW